jgi:serine/threonine-protein kinase HipA
MAKINTRKEILVYASWAELNGPTLLGTLNSDIVRGDEIFSFEYSKSWLESKFAQVIDPDLKLYSGPQYLNGNKNNFGIFLDSSPDRWGQVIMQRREAILAKLDNRQARTLMGSDYLLGVYDENRVGGLRFKEEAKGPFLNQDEKLAAPPRASISELQEASLKFERDEGTDSEHIKWLNMLIAPGSSLGGARPKASIIDSRGNLWIAKFPSASDTKDVGGWEMVANALAKKCRISVVEAEVEKFSNQYHTFLAKRFDRMGKERIHFASAMTMLGYVDGINYKSGVSYLEIADFIKKYGANVNDDLKELWRRIVFSIAVSNTDDHLRNHGFILTEKGWLLSPAFDINPNETGTGLSLNISQIDNSLSFELAIEVAGEFRLKKDEAERIIKDIKNKVNDWKAIADKYNISKREQVIMEKAFEIK